MPMVKFKVLVIVSMLLFTGTASVVLNAAPKSKKVDLTYQETSDGISFSYNELFYSVEVLSDDIIHVIKSRKENYADILGDIVINKKAEAIKFDVREEKGFLTLKTSKVKVKIGNDATFYFFDEDGKELLSELESGVAFSEDSTLNAVQQSFHVGDEALYGLGQYQSGIMNWKNTPVQLRQYNQEIAIPFLQSTKQYGILWNNNSVTDFNHPEEEINFTTVISEEDNIRQTTFTPAISGEYNFLVESPNPKCDRREGAIVLTIDGDTIIQYSTIWVPDCYTGKAVLKKGKEYTIEFKNSTYQTEGKVFVNSPNFNKTVFASREGDAVDYYFIHGKTPSQVMAGYRELTGSAPLFPKWAYGFWQCRERYHNQEELLENAREYRKRKIPVDNIVQDWYYWNEGTKGPSWHPERYPDPKAMCDELESLNLNIMVSVWPEIKDDKIQKSRGLENHAIIKKKKNKEQRYHTLDFYNPEIGMKYASLLSDSMYSKGVDAIWLDGTEPASKPHDYDQTYVGRWDKVANSFSLLVTKAVYEGKMKDYPEKRVFNLTRSAFTGQQRYSVASWSGDVAGTWEQFAEQIPAGLNFCMAGIPYWTTDIGGFFRDSVSLNPVYDDQYTNQEYIELLTRWFQYGTFTPLFRIHGFISETEIWRYGKAFEENARRFIDLRYQLMPYIYSTAWEVTNNDDLMMKPLVYNYPNDAETWNIKDQFLFGNNLMVCPVTEYQARTRQVYLPEGDWYNYWTNEKFKGGREVIVQAPLEKMPIFIKAGSILPLGPKVQYSTEKNDEPIQIKIYGGEDSEFTLYEDDNLSNDYIKGEFTEIRFSYNDQTSELNITSGDGQFKDVKSNPRHFIVSKVGQFNNHEVIFSGDDINVQL